MGFQYHSHNEAITSSDIMDASVAVGIAVTAPKPGTEIAEALADRDGRIMAMVRIADVALPGFVAWRAVAEIGIASQISHLVEEKRIDLLVNVEVAAILMCELRNVFNVIGLGEALTACIDQVAAAVATRNSGEGGSGDGARGSAPS